VFFVISCISLFLVLRRATSGTEQGKDNKHGMRPGSD
jgi:hypothetical protein